MNHEEHDIADEIPIPEDDSPLLETEPDSDDSKKHKKDKKKGADQPGIFPE